MASLESPGILTLFSEYEQTASGTFCRFLDGSVQAGVMMFVVRASPDVGIHKVSESHVKKTSGRKGR